MKQVITLATIFTACLFLACQPEEQSPKEVNPPAPTFDLEGSDSLAIVIADEIMEASGGRENWDKARYFSWVFANGRKHYWDKHTGDIRIESGKDSVTYLMNVNSMEGRIQIKGRELTDPDSLATFIKRGNSLWINDSYWLVMPFKMKDDGVTLKYLGGTVAKDGRPGEAVSMTFKGVGDTPENKYLVIMDTKSHLISEWAYFMKAEQDSANFVMPWKDYRVYGNLKLSSDRDRLQLTEISVDGEMPAGIFTQF